VDQPGEDGIFLRRPADHRKRPDRAVPVVHVLDAEHGKIVRQAVVAQVVAKGTFRLAGLRIEVAGDAEVGLGVDG